MKAVLISIQPKWCELIANGKKTVEVRKTRPKLETPFKCYIYCTKDNTDYIPSRIWWKADETGFQHIMNGTVIGEFVCNCMTALKADNMVQAYYNNIKDTCLTDEEIKRYASGKKLYYWHISNLVIYDAPKELSEYYRECEEPYCDDCPHLCFENTPNSYEGWCKYDEKIPITRPPQSWCYVEELR